MNQGISTRQGAHHVAQKLSRTTLPRKSESLTGLPEASLSTKSGAILRFCGFTNPLLAVEVTLLNWPTHAETQRCANARVEGRAISGTLAATTPAATHPHVR